MLVEHFRDSCKSEEEELINRENNNIRSWNLTLAPILAGKLVVDCCFTCSVLDFCNKPDHQMFVLVIVFIQPLSQTVSEFFPRNSKYVRICTSTLTYHVPKNQCTFGFIIGGESNLDGWVESYTQNTEGNLEKGGKTNAIRME